MGVERDRGEGARGMVVLKQDCTTTELGSIRVNEEGAREIRKK